MTDVPRVWWLNHEFHVYQANAVTWNAVPGLYVFARLDLPHGWVPLYVGESGDLSSRLSGHPKWPEAARLGATHIHARIEPFGEERLKIEKQLIAAYQPWLNRNP
ncbi:MAG: hypothetical protein F4Y20_08055 [Acidobacteria bacterium]|nr:hypothetical protein [Acidobacteriota bacterium]MYH23161.1 hypothetical protein [Acidobacteriota bacterium]